MYIFFHSFILILAYKSPNICCFASLIVLVLCFMLVCMVNTSLSFPPLVILWSTRVIRWCLFCLRTYSPFVVSWSPFLLMAIPPFFNMISYSFCHRLTFFCFFPCAVSRMFINYRSTSSLHSDTIWSSRCPLFSWYIITKLSYQVLFRFYHLILNLSCFLNPYNPSTLTL